MGSASPTRVLLLLPHLGGGGAEHVIATLARCLSREKYELHLGLVTQSPSECFQARNLLPPSIHIHPLGAPRVRAGAMRLLKLVWQVKPEVILSGIAHLNLLVLLLRPLFPSRTRILVRQNGALSATLEAGNRPRLSRLLFRVGYRRADRIICQTNSMAEELQEAFNIDEARLVVLSNPVDILGIRESTAQNDQAGKLAGSMVLAVARLAPEKGIDLLLEAFARIKTRFPLVALQIAGAGSRESSLKTQCKILGIRGQVTFLGQVESPRHFFRSASVFVLSSRHEGLPNALLEAAAAGLPIVATPASRGLADLLRDKPGVWLASDISVEALESALSDALLHLQPAQRFHHRWIEPFALKQAIPAYESEIDRALLETGT
jgi:glycosyltransferase involved in cell wall biosynthesis